jgi:hypothetical protein
MIIALEEVEVRKLPPVIVAELVIDPVNVPLSAYIFPRKKAFPVVAEI